MMTGEEFSIEGIQPIADEKSGMHEGDPPVGTVGMSKADIRHNMIACIALDGIYAAGAMDLFMVLQPMMLWLGASNIMLGQLTAAMSLAVVGSLLSPWISRRFTYKKWYMFVAHAPSVLILGIMGFGLVFSAELGLTKATLLPYVFGAMVAFFLLAGFLTLPHQEYIAACIPMSHRGRFTSLSIGLVGGTGAMVTALIAKRILEHVPKPMSFGYVLILIWVLCHLGYLFSLLGRERPTPVDKVPRAWSKDMLKAFWDDKRFLRLNLYMVFHNILVWPVLTFINVYGLRDRPEGLGMPVAASAMMLVIAQLVRAAASTPVGYITDRITPKRTMPYCTVLAAVGVLPAIFMRNPLGVYISVGILALYYMTFTASFAALQYGLPAPENRAGHFTIFFFANYAVNAVGPIFMGWMCDKLPYVTVFTGVALLGLLMVPLGKYFVSTFSDDLSKYG